MSESEEGGLTDSTIASSSVARKRLEPLCCFLFCWLLRGVGEKRDAVPDVELPRCWPKKLAVAIEAGWLWAGETGTEDAEALDEDAAGGGLVDMAPSQGSTMR